MMSRIAPCVHRTSLVSAAGGNWKCIPRTVPRFLLKATLAWAMSGLSPCAANSRWQKTRAKNPRLRSEERRVGKACRPRRMTHDQNKKPKHLNEIDVEDTKIHIKAQRPAAQPT